MKYTTLKSRHQKEVNEFPIAAAFNQKQFEEGMRKLGLEPTDTDKIYKIGNTGCFYRKTDSKALHEMLDRHEAEMTEAMKDETFAYEAFLYELGNHEYCVTGDVADAIAALGYSYEEIYGDPFLKNALMKAMHEQENAGWA